MITGDSKQNESLMAAEAAAAAGSGAVGNRSMETGRRRLTLHRAQSFYGRRPGVHAARDGLEAAAAASAAEYAEGSGGGFDAASRTGMGKWESTPLLR